MIGFVVAVVVQIYTFPTQTLIVQNALVCLQLHSIVGINYPK